MITILSQIDLGAQIGAAGLKILGEVGTVLPVALSIWGIIWGVGKAKYYLTTSGEDIMIDENVARWKAEQEAAGVIVNDHDVGYMRAYHDEILEDEIDQENINDAVIAGDWDEVELIDSERRERHKAEFSQD